MKGYLVLALIIAAVLPAAAAQQTVNYTAEKVEVLEPECANCNSGLALAPSKDRHHPQGKLLDDLTAQRMKDFANYDPNVPAGTLVPFGGELSFEPAAPPLRSSFEGINQEVGEGFFPPDTQVAAGPGNIVQATNGAIRLATKTNSILQTVNWNTFFAKPGAFLFDPRVFFDPSSHRFLVVVLEFKSNPQTSLIRLAVSQSENPASLTQGWCRYSMGGKSQGTWSDYPSLGINEKWLAISTNQFRFSDNQYVKAMVKATNATALGNNATACPKLTFSTFSFPTASGTSGTLLFSQSYSPTSLAGTPLFAVSTNLGTSNFYDLWRVSGDGATPSMSRARILGRTHTSPPDAKHKNPGADYNTDFNRVLSATHRNGTVSFAFGTGCNFGDLPNESCVRIAQIVPTDAAGTLGFEADYGGGQNKYFWMPAVAANSANDLAVVFQQSGTTSFLGTAFSGKRSTATSMEPFKVLQAGKCNLINLGSGDPRNRTGDYTGISVDPSDGKSFWLSGEYSTPLNGKCRWGTRIGKASY